MGGSCSLHPPPLPAVAPCWLQSLQRTVQKLLLWRACGCTWLQREREREGGGRCRGLSRCKPVRLFAFQICRRWRCHLLLPLLLPILRCLISLACLFLLCSCCPGEARSLVSAACGSLSLLCCVLPGFHIRSALGLAKLMQS